MNPLAPDQVAVALLTKVRKDSATLEEPGKLIPAFAFVVALVPTAQDIPLRDEHIVPPDQFSGVAKFKIPGAAPPMVPPVKFTVAVEMVSVPVPKSMAAPLKFTVPKPLIGPLCAYTPLAKLIVPPLPAVYVPEQLDPQFPLPVNDIVPLLPKTVPLLWIGVPIVLVAVPPVFSKVPALLNATAFPPPNERSLSLV